MIAVPAGNPICSAEAAPLAGYLVFSQISLGRSHSVCVSTRFLAQFKQNDLQISSASPVFVLTLLFNPELPIIVLSLKRKSPPDGH